VYTIIVNRGFERDFCRFGETARRETARRETARLLICWQLLDPSCEDLLQDLSFGIPTIPDQAYNMRRVEALGVGKSLTWKEFYSNPTVLLDAVHAVLSNRSFAENVRRMHKVF